MTKISDIILKKSDDNSKAMIILSCLVKSRRRNNVILSIAINEERVERMNEIKVEVFNQINN